MNGGDSGGFNRLIYDRCEFEKRTKESTDPLSWRMYPGKYENCKKCIYDNQFTRPFDNDIVDRESELKGISRRASRCGQFKYNPGCKKSAQCTSTFDPSNPIVLAQEVCPIIHNNIPRINGPGYTLDTEPFCPKPEWRHPL